MLITEVLGTATSDEKPNGVGPIRVVFFFLKELYLLWTGIWAYSLASISGDFDFFKTLGFEGLASYAFDGLSFLKEGCLSFLLTLPDLARNLFFPFP
jgi:hypothetical protein